MQIGNSKYKKIAVITLATMVSSVTASGLDIPDFPLQTTAFVEPNVMFLIDNSGSMGTVDSGTKETRLEIAQRVAKDIIEETSDVRFCLGSFNEQQGGQVLSECAIPTKNNKGTSDIETAINKLKAENWTPLAEAYYEMTGYFKNGGTIYNNYVGNRESPIEWRCQKNYIIALTDGAPYYDSYFPGLDTLRLGDYDRDSFDSGSPDGNFYNKQGKYFFLDDLAKYANETDFRTGSVDGAGEDFDDPSFDIQNISTYTVGFTLNNSDALQMLQDAAEKEGYGNGSYYKADNYEQLKTSFSEALTQITNTSESVATSTANSAEIVGGTRLYQSRYTANDWVGELIALDIDLETFSVASELAWSATFDQNSNTRVVYTGHNGGSLFNKNAFTTSEIKEYFGNKNIIDYIKGKEISGYRERIASSSNSSDVPLGDIINSSPVYVEPPKEDVYLDADLSASYTAFVEQQKDKKDMIYVGANDGMLHGFDAETGIEEMAYVPKKILADLKDLADEDYKHKFYVDSTPAVEHVFVNGHWKTVLIGSLGRGGQGVFALDITEGEFNNTSQDAASTFLWEFTDEDDADLGLSLSSPQIMRLNDGKFYAVVSSGYNNSVQNEDEASDTVSSSGEAVVFLIDIATGKVEYKLSTGAGKKTIEGSEVANGLAEISGVDINNDKKVDYLYAGDLFGNVWKFDVSSSSATMWDTKLLFSATDDEKNEQSITAKITPVYLTNEDKVILLFGTGKYLEVSDTSPDNINLQSFYGLLDEYKSSTYSINGRSELLQQSITYQGIVEYTTETDESVSEEVRITSDNTYENNIVDKGWYINLWKPTDIADGSRVYEKQGEQVITTAVYRETLENGVAVGNGRVFFVSNISNESDRCLPSSTGFLTQLDAYTGSRLSKITLDMNDDGVVDEKDGVKTTDESGNEVLIGASGYATTSVSSPVILDVNDSGRSILYETSDCVVGEEECANRRGIDTSGDYIEGTRSEWREIRSD